MSRLVQLVDAARSTYVDFVKWPAPKWRLQRSARVPLGGRTVQLEIPARDLGMWHLLHRGTYEPHTIAAIQSAVRPGDLFFDVGAHVGVMTLVAAERVGETGRIVAFEPDPVAREIMARNLARNRVRAEIVPLAVADTARTMQLEIRGIRSGLGNSSTGAVPTADVIPATSLRGPAVSSTSLAEYIVESGLQPNVIKVDIEGGEALAIPGLGNPPSSLRTIIVEFHPREFGRFGRDPREFAAALERLGRVELLEERGPIAEVIEGRYGNQTFAVSL